MTKGRTSKVILTPECRVLRELRLKHGLSMREAGARLGCSDSYISQIENGRANAPKGEALARFLRLYGGISAKYFGELVREWKHEKTDIEIIQETLPKLKPRNLKIIKLLVEQLAKDDDY